MQGQTDYLLGIGGASSDVLKISEIQNICGGVRLLYNSTSKYFYQLTDVKQA